MTESLNSGGLNWKLKRSQNNTQRSRSWRTSKFWNICQRWKSNEDDSKDKGFKAKEDHKGDFDNEKDIENEKDSKEKGVKTTEDHEEENNSMSSLKAP